MNGGSSSTCLDDCIIVASSGLQPDRFPKKTAGHLYHGRQRAVAQVVFQGIQQLADVVGGVLWQRMHQQPLLTELFLKPSNTPPEGLRSQRVTVQFLYRSQRRSPWVFDPGRGQVEVFVHLLSLLAPVVNQFEGQMPIDDTATYTPLSTPGLYITHHWGIEHAKTL